MAKPILVVRVSYRVNDDIDMIQKYMAKNVPDYHVFIIPDALDRNFEFEVFNVQDYPEIQFEELKNKLESEFIKDKA